MITLFICIHVHESFWKVILKWCLSDAWFFKRYTWNIHSFIHVELMVLIESIYDEFYSTFKDECSQGGKSVMSRKFRLPKMPLASLFYRGRMVFFRFSLCSRCRMGILRPYLRLGRKIEWDSTFGKILEDPERKTKFSETRQNWRKTVGSATLGRRAAPPTNLIRPLMWPRLRGAFS